MAGPGFTFKPKKQQTPRKEKEIGWTPQDRRKVPAKPAASKPALRTVSSPMVEQKKAESPPKAPEPAAKPKAATKKKAKPKGKRK
jgi:hypothetical protein